MIDIDKLETQIQLLTNEIIKLDGIRGNLKKMLEDEKNNVYTKLIPIINKYTDIELDKDKQNKLYEEIGRRKISDTLKQLSNVYKFKYIKEDGQDWANLLIIKREIK